MCGIAGVMNRRAALPPPEIERLQLMAGALQHRGPDEFGVYRDDQVGLAHSRLSIIDLKTGQQPMTNERGTLWITFNGEIFNYVELRTELEAKGHQFRSRSDTEVIVHGYEEWGADAFRRFNGQWAVGLWDSERRELVLARDPFGVRPLYVTQHDGRLLFASEVKALFAGDPTLPRQLDPAGFAQLFTFWTPVSPQTVFKGIEEIEPGTVCVYDRDGVRQTRSWDPCYPIEGATPPTARGLDDTVEEVREALRDATNLRMLRADVPVGSYLSGGLDSSLIAALGLQAKGANFSTFSLRFEDDEYDETGFQRAMSRRLQSDHHELMVTRDDIAAAFPAVVFHTERPILRTAPAPLFLLSKLVRDNGIKVVLTGEGADEMFAGYDLFREAKVRRFWARQPNSLWRPRLLDRLYPYLQRSPVAQRAVARQFFGRNLDQSNEPGFGHGTRWQGTAALKRLLAKEFRNGEDRDVVTALVDSLPANFRRWSSLAQDQFIEIHTLLSGYLLSSQGDRMLMAHSVEGRFPFLDRRVAALAESLPASHKLHVLDEKHVLKRAAVDLVPTEILRRPKQPYRAPDALSFRGKAALEWIEDVASARTIKEAGVFEPQAARGLLDKCVAKTTGQFSNADNMAVVGILSTQLLHHHFISRRPDAKPPRELRTVVDRVREAANRS